MPKLDILRSSRLSGSNHTAAAAAGFMHPPMHRSKSVREYWGLFAVIFLMYWIIYIAFRMFMLDKFAGDFLEQKWIADGNEPYKVPLSALALLASCHIGASSKAFMSDRYITMLVLFPILPMIVLYSHRGASPWFLTLSIVCLVLIWLVNKIKFPRFSISNLEILTPDTMFIVTASVSAIFFISSIATGNLEFLNFDINRVYDFRREAYSSRSPVVEYIATNLVAVMLPLATVSSLNNRRYNQVFVIVLITVIIFGFTSHKSHLASSLFAISVYYIVKKFGFVSFILSLGAVVAFGVALHIVLPQFDLFGTMAIRRTFFVPAYVNYLYYDWFSVSGHYYWADSRISFGLTRNPYGIGMPQLMMEIYSDADLTRVRNTMGSLNTGFLGSGYGQAGYVGMLIYSILVAGMLKVGNRVAEKVGMLTAFAGMSHYFLSIVFTSADFPTTLLSHGTLLWIVLAMILKPSNEITGAAEPLMGDRRRENTVRASSSR